VYNKRVKKSSIVIFLALIVGIVLRSLPGLKAPAGYFGYDFGFYLQAANNAQSVLNISGVLGGFNHPLFYVLKTFHINPEIFLNITLFLFSILTIAIFILTLSQIKSRVAGKEVEFTSTGLSAYSLRKSENSLAVFGAILLAASLPQAELYYTFLWKNIAALPAFAYGLFLTGRMLLQERTRRDWVVLGCCMLWLLVTHRTSAIIFFLTVGLCLFFYQLKHKLWKFIAIEAMLVGLGAVVFWDRIWMTATNLIYNNNYYVREGIFLNAHSLVYIFWLPALLALFYIISNLRTFKNLKPHAVWGVLLVLTLGWYLFKLPFYNRILVFFDLALVFYAVLGLAKLFSFRNSFLRYGVVPLVCIVAVVQAGWFVLQKEPIVTTEQVAEIQEFTNPDTRALPGLNVSDWPTILVVSADDASIVWGYAQQTHVKAPGLFGDTKTYEEWKDFWADKNQKQFLGTYQRPLFLYQRSYHISGEASPCLQQITQNFYEYTCK